MQDPKTETRNPKSETVALKDLGDSGFGFRISFGFRNSDFGFQPILCC